MEKSLKKEVIFYAIIVVILVVVSILNNAVWKIGKSENKTKNEIKTEQQEVQQLEVNNITYNVPFEEKWLD